MNTRCTELPGVLVTHDTTRFAIKYLGARRIRTRALLPIKSHAGETKRETICDLARVIY